ALRPRHAGRGLRRGRQLVPDAHRRGPAPPAGRGGDRPPGRDPGLDRGGARPMTTEPLPTPPAGPFPTAAPAPLEDTQLRRELGLNAALAEAGIAATETDLAELIVQLAGERSSHILVPAIHKNRAEIRALFRRRLGEPGLTDEPRDLARAARAHLRRKFLSVP